jgi:hypothetical protein
MTRLIAGTLGLNLWKSRAISWPGTEQLADPRTRAARRWVALPTGACLGGCASGCRQAGLRTAGKRLCVWPITSCLADMPPAG